MSMARMGKDTEPDELPDDEDTVLELCALVEEYKEALETLSGQHSVLEEEATALRRENEALRETVHKQSETITRLDESVNQLMEEIEVKNSVIETKDSDLQSLQHCLGVIHRRKVEVDDQTQLEQSRIIEKLYEEKNKISEAYSANLKILEDYLEMINARDSEIMDLRLAVQSYEDSTGVLDLSDSDWQKDAFPRPATATVDGTPVRVSPQLKSMVPSPPLYSPPRSMRYGLRNAQLAGGAVGTTLGDGPSPSAKALAHIRAASAAAVRRSSFTRQPYISDEDEQFNRGDDDDAEEAEGSPTVPVTINRSRVTKLTRHSTTGMLTAAKSPDISSNNINPDQKAAALQKYRKYASMHSKDGSEKGSAETENAPKWSDIGKHERLFDKVDIIKDRNLKRASSTGMKSDANPSVPLYGNQCDDEMHDSMEYAPESNSTSLPHRSVVEPSSYSSSSLHSALGRSKSLIVAAGAKSSGTDSVRSSADGIVEVFINSDSSNPATPERQKPNKPLFKPPFSKPVFNEFTGKSKSSTSSSNSGLPPSSTPATMSGIAVSSTRKSNSSINDNNFPSKAKFDAYVQRKGANYELGDKESESAGQKSQSFSYSDSKAVTWADAKGTNLTLGYEEYERPGEDKFSGSASMSGRKSGAGLSRGTSTSATDQSNPVPPPVKENGWLSWRSSATSIPTNSSGNNNSSVKKSTITTSAANGNGSPNYSRL